MTSAAATVFHLCASCAVANAYGDMSALNTDNTAEVVAFMYDHGMLAIADDIDPPGVWLCECCGMDQLGAARTFTTL